MSKAKRAAALLLCVGLALVLFTSSVYIAYEAGHDCTGEQCEICEHIREAAAILHGFALLGVLLHLLFALPSLRRATAAADGLRLRPLSTLVSWKVRLND